jgi:hypothetical protein
MEVRLFRPSVIVHSVLGVILVGLIAQYTASRLDRRGWIPHIKSVDLYMDGNRERGQSLVCTGMQSEESRGGAPVISSLFCTDNLIAVSPLHTRMTFWGRVSRSDTTPIDEASNTKFQWQCKRTIIGITCHATN